MRTEIPRIFPKGYPANPQTWGERLRKRRMDLALTQEQLAERLRCTGESIRKWERGQEWPLSRRWSRIGEVLGAEMAPLAENAAVQLRAARLRTGLTQVELAKLAGMNVRSVRNSENPRYRPRPTTIGKLLVILAKTSYLKSP